MVNKYINVKRRTNELVRICYSYLKEHGQIDAETIVHLTRLTWITNSNNNSWLRTVRNPSLSVIFSEDLSKQSNQDISAFIAHKTNKSYSKISDLIEQPTGFTNVYLAYRNSFAKWMSRNISMCEKACDLVYKNEVGQAYYKASLIIHSLPSISGAGNASDKNMPASNFLTPLLFALSPDKKFPIINKRQNVKNLLQSLNLDNAPLPDQFSALHDLINFKTGIKDAAVLDSMEFDLHDFLDTPSSPQIAQVSDEKPVLGKDLPLKDEDDISVVIKSGSKKSRNIHNQITNRLRSYFSEFSTLEGASKSCMYDLLVKEFYTDADLLIEVKSSNKAGDIRMAIGQLYDYGRQLSSPHYPAIFIPSPPSQNLKDLAKYADVMLMWFINNNIYCYDPDAGGEPFSMDI